MDVVRRMDEWGWPAWIGAMVLGFIIFWPLGLALLIYLIWSGRMANFGCSGKRGWKRRAQRAAHFASSSGNAAFDEYRDETLRRLEDEQREFSAFLDQLRKAKDKAEFDQFMAERRNRPDPGPEERGTNNGDDPTSVPQSSGSFGPGPAPSAAY